MRACPHTDVRHCPLYIAAHSTGHGCDDGRLDEGSCAVSRGMNYAQQVELLRVRVPGLVEQAAWNEDLEQRRRQRTANLRLNGIH